MLPSTFDERNNHKACAAAVDNSATESDTAFMSDECDEKRSYTPQPRQISMLGGLKTQASKLNRAAPSQHQHQHHQQQQNATGGGGGIAQNYGLMANRSMIGLASGDRLFHNNNNISTISCLNNRSNISDHLSAHYYVSRGDQHQSTKPPTQQEEEKTNQKSGFLSSLFNNRSASLFTRGGTANSAVNEATGGAVTSRTAIQEV